MLRMNNQAALCHGHTSTRVAAKFARTHHPTQAEGVQETGSATIPDNRSLAQPQKKGPSTQSHLHARVFQLPAKYAMSAVGFEPTRSCLQWILSPPP